MRRSTKPEARLEVRLQTMGINGWDYDYWYQNHPDVPMVSPTIGVAGRFTVGDYGANNWIEGGTNWQVSDSVTLLKGKHNMKMGLDLYHRQHHLDVDEVQTGDFGFDGTKSGNPTADFLLGRWTAHCASSTCSIRATNPGAGCSSFRTIGR